jgi:Bacteriophage baseplate protein W
MRAISFPFRFSAYQGVALAATNEEIVRGQVIDALMTNQGERVFRPRYGCDIQAALFDPRDELVRRDAAGIIRKRLEDLVPRCIVRSCTVEAPVDSTILFVNIIYKPSVLAADVSVSVPVDAGSSFFQEHTRMTPGELIPAGDQP